jgi:ATP synthase protein I
MSAAMANETNPIIASTARVAKAAPGIRAGRWDEDDDGTGPMPFKALSREEALVLRRKEPPLSPWRVIGAQGGVGVGVALLAMLLSGKTEMMWSALYGAATVVVPGALLARGMTSRLTSASPVVSAVSVMLWEMVKIATAVALLAMAPKVVPSLSWPVLLTAMAVCLSVYWFALLWRGRKSSSK